MAKMTRITCSKCEQVFWSDDEAEIGSGLCLRCALKAAVVKVRREGPLIERKLSARRSGPSAPHDPPAFAAPKTQPPPEPAPPAPVAQYPAPRPPLRSLPPKPSHRTPLLVGLIAGFGLAAAVVLVVYLVDDPPPPQTRTATPIPSPIRTEETRLPGFFENPSSPADDKPAPTAATRPPPQSQPDPQPAVASRPPDNQPRPDVPASAQTRPDARQNNARADELCRKSQTAPQAYAIAILNQAIELAPNHIEAHILLSSRLANAKKTSAAVQAADKARELLAQGKDASPEMEAALAAVEHKLQAARWPLSRWATARPALADRYRILAGNEPAAASLSGVTALKRASALQPANTELAKMRDQAVAAANDLPAPADVPDPKTAARLHARATGLISAGKFKDARELLAQAVSLDRQRARYWCDLAVCCQASGSPGLAGACLKEASARLDGETDPQAARLLETRIRILSDRADPKVRLLDELDAATLKDAHTLIAASKEIGDTDTADAIAADLRAMGLTPPEEPADPAVGASAGRCD